METIGLEVDRWIDEEDLAVNPTLKVVRKYDIYADMDEDEVQAHREFISWYLAKDHELMLSIPAAERTFWAIELDEYGCDVSAFNTHDFERLYPFNKYQWKLNRIYDKVKDLAITHSCASDEEGRKKIHQRYINLVNSEFRNRGIFILEHYRKYKVWMYKDRVISSFD